MRQAMSSGVLRGSLTGWQRTTGDEICHAELDLFPDLPLVLMARIGHFRAVGVRAHPQHDVNNVLQRHVGDMGSMPAPPTQVVPDPVRWDVRPARD